MKILVPMAIVFAMFFALTAGPSNELRTNAQDASKPIGLSAKTLNLELGGKVTLSLVQIPSGKFLMGSPETEKGRNVNEAQHEVTITKSFYMGLTHVTVDQYATFVKDSGYQTNAEKAGWSIGVEIRDGQIDIKQLNGCSWRTPSFDQRGDHPVVQVSWDDAKAFCDWLSKKSGKTVELPTEAQWEYACRAGTTTAYPWGDNPDDGKGWSNCADQSLKRKLLNAPADWGFFSWDDGFVFTAPTGIFRANAFGLYDMNGNAQQWCQDHYENYEPGVATDPIVAGPSRLRVLRGGSWDATPTDCRSARRTAQFADYRLASIGFRIIVLE